MSDSLYDRILAEIEEIKVIDTHEHLAHPDLWLNRKLDFSWLFFHYTSSDAVSAGLPPENVPKIQGQELSEHDKWRLLEPYWPKIRNTAYSKCLLESIQEVYEIEDLNRDTYKTLGEAMREKQTPTFFRDTLRAAGIECSMWQWINHEEHSDIGFREEYDREMYVQDVHDPFMFADPDAWRKRGHKLNNLSDYEELIDAEITRLAPVISAYKIGHAYERTLSFDEVARDDASSLFEKLLASGKDMRTAHPTEQFKWTPEGKALMDYICHFAMACCEKNDLPVKVHTGIQEGNGNYISHSDPTLLTNLFLKFPKTRFDLYHIGYPFQHKMTVLAKNFQNVRVDFCWAWIIAPTPARAALHEYLEAIPYTEIHGFGGDYIMVEPVVGHLRAAQRNIAKVLTEKVEEKWFTEDEAVTVANALFRDNALEFFRIEEKRANALKHLDKKG